MGIYELAFHHLILPIVEWKYGMTIRKHLRELEKTQWWSIEKLRELQNDRLRRLIEHAYEKVPYYRSMFQERGWTPKDIRSVDDLSKLPTLTKRKIWDNYEKLLSADFKQRKPKRGLTSGSTAERLEFYIDWEAWSMSWACIYLGWRMAGYRFGDKMVTLSGFALFPDEKDMTLRDRVRMIIERNLPLSVMRMTEDTMMNYADLIAKHQPRFIRGYPSGIYTFAEYIKEKGLCPARPKAIFTTAEVLLPRFRKVIEEVFQCPVFDNYGCGDGGGSAIQCPEHNGYHVPIQRVAMEFLDDEGKLAPASQTGRVILTDLFNYSMPFIRYEVGDMATPTHRLCSCGRTLPLIDSLDGRTSDIIRFRDGSVLSGLVLSAVFEHLPIQQYQIVQLDEDNLLIRIIRERDYNQAHTDRLLRITEHHIGPHANVKLEFVEEIPVTRAGKQLFIVSNLAQV